MSACVLIVDDSATMRMVIRKSLQLSGLDVGEVIEAGNGIQALAQLARQKADVVLLDINMPIMTGVQFIQRLAEDHRLRDIPVVIASTEGSEVRVKELLGMGARGFVRKPFSPEQLRAALAPLIAAGSPPAPAMPAGDDSF
ncbi:MAG: response regulator [Phycisphaerales bacterium]|nr:response regulator [Phycisphaerales bacterium]